MKTVMTKHKLWIGVLALLAAALFLHQPAHAQTPDVVIDLCATTGSLSLPGSVTVPIWGYAVGDCSGSPAAQLPGPTITVDAGDTVQITLHNNLTEATALNFPALAMVPDTTGAAGNGGTHIYTFTATEPGTFLYEAGLLPNTQYQVSMGLYGALVVNAATPGQAYDNAAAAFDDQAVLVLSEIDPILNNSGSPATFDMRKYTPKYFLINGKAYPNTDDIPTAAGNRVLLRYLNTGLMHHSMTILGLPQQVIALDGSLLTHPYAVTAETIAPGQGLDVVAAVPAAAPDGARFPLYQAGLLLNNRTAAGFGGMMTFLTTAGGGPGPGDTTGPVTSGAVAAPSGADVLLTATISDAASDVAAAEYYLDSTSGTAVSMFASDGAFDSSTESVQATISAATLAGLSVGNHSVYVRGQDMAGNWGSFNLATLHVDNLGPTTSALSLTPNPSGGSVSVVLLGTGNDTATGGSNVVLAEYFIDAPGANGSGTTIVPGGSGTVVNLSATIPAGLAEGIHPIFVHSQDSNGLWGDFATINLRVDKTGPTTTAVVANPNPNNGSIPYSLSQPSVRVNATISDGLVLGVQSNISAVEGFIDTVGANGSGFLFTPVDGLYNSPVENGFVFIPLTTINLLSEGVHTISVHGRDASGNWGAVQPINFIIDKTKPTLSAAASPNPTVGATSVTLSATANEALARAEWFMGADPGIGNGTAMTVLSSNATAAVNVSTWANGSYTLYLRAKDLAGNWSIINSVNLTVSPPLLSGLYFSTLGNASVPGVGGTADDADIYRRNGSSFSRIFDASVAGLPGNANVDGLVILSTTQFYVSFSADGGTNVSGLGSVQDEDIILYNNGVWSMYFDGSTQGLTTANHDLDAFDIVGGVLYFSTFGNGAVSGVGGTADDADIYSWNGASFSRVFDASVSGFAGGANVDGLNWVGPNVFHLSFSANGGTAVPGMGTAQDEDVVFNNNGVWSMYFDGSVVGLTSNDHDLDAIHIP